MGLLIGHMVQQQLHSPALSSLKRLATGLGMGPEKQNSVGTS